MLYICTYIENASCNINVTERLEALQEASCSSNDFLIDLIEQVLLNF